MGKKTKKTKWRTLEIPAPVGKNYENIDVKWDVGRRTFSPNYQRCDKINRGHDVALTTVSSDSFRYSSSKDEKVKTLLEDEYTKITTPRQDVLFKKGYLTKRKTTENACIDNMATDDCVSNDDFSTSSYANGDDSLPPQLGCPTPQPSYVDSSALFYGGGGAGYEIYDPYMGNVSAVVVSATASQYAAAGNACPPILTSMPCGPLPLQPVQWFNPVPTSDWCCSYPSHADDASTRYSNDSQNASGASLEPSCAAESLTPASLNDDPTTSSCAAALYQSSYVYPGYMFGAPIYNVDGVDLQYCAAQSPVLSSGESTTSKKKKKRKRRRRTERETKEGWESSADENCNGSVSCNEYAVSDCASQEEFVGFDDDTVTGHKYFDLEVRNGYRDRDCLPHGNVNAAPFVPAGRSIADITAAKSCADAEALFDAVTADEDRDNCYVDQHYAMSTSDVYCKSYSNDRNERKTDRGSSSNNSDSGISSPGSEDHSHTGEDFQKATKMGKLKNDDHPLTAVEPLVDKVTKISSSASTDIIIFSGQKNDVSDGNKNKLEEQHNENVDLDDVLVADDNGEKNFKIIEEIDGQVVDKEKLNEKYRLKKPSKAFNEYFAQEARDYRELNTAGDGRSEKDDKNLSRNGNVALTNSNEKEKFTPEEDSCTTQRTDKKRSKMMRRCEADNAKSSAANIQNEMESRSKAVVQFSDDGYRNGISKTLVNNEKQPKASNHLQNLTPIMSEFETSNECKYSHIDVNILEHASNPKIHWNINVDDHSKIGDVKASDECENQPVITRICDDANDNNNNNNNNNNNDHDDDDDDDDNNNNIDNAVDSPICIAENSPSDKLTDTDANSWTQSSVESESLCSRNAMSCREKTESESSRTLEMIEITARCVVDEILEHAEARVRSSITCDKRQLPITQAVTNWLNERGGLPTNEGILVGVTDDQRNQRGIIKAKGKQPNFTSNDGTAMCDGFDKPSKSKTSCIIC